MRPRPPADSPRREIPLGRIELLPEHQLLEVWGFDLLAQVEAMLRHAREYQREVQRLRGILGRGQTATSDREPLDAVRTHVEELRRASLAMTSALDDITRVVEQRDAGSDSDDAT